VRAWDRHYGGHGRHHKVGSANNAWGVKRSLAAAADRVRRRQVALHRD